MDGVEKDVFVTVIYNYCVLSTYDFAFRSSGTCHSGSLSTILISCL